MRESTGTKPSLVDRIALDIQSGFYGPGAWLKQIDMQARYEVTRLEVRKALDLLVLKRLLEHIPNRGYHVYVPDMRRSSEVRDIRVLLECGAAEAIMGKVSAKQIKRIRTLAQDFQSLVITGTLMEQYESNQAFHRAMYESCPNAELVSLIQEIRAGTPSAPATQWKSRARVEQSAREHFEMIEALEKKDLPRLKQVIAAHITQTETR